MGVRSRSMVALQAHDANVRSRSASSPSVGSSASVSDGRHGRPSTSWLSRLLSAGGGVARWTRTDVSRPPPGFLVKYAIDEEVIGEGAFAVTYLGADLATNRKVAIKVVTKQEGKLERERAEIEAHQRAMCNNQPFVAQLVDVFEGQRAHFVVMELLSGGSLLERFEMQRGIMTRTEIAKIVGQVAAALGHLHSCGVAHLDLKLQNVCFTDNSDDATIKLIDFGLAGVFDPTEQAHGSDRSPLARSVGTASYAAPEIFAGTGKYGPEADMWSLGVIAFILLSGGDVPFRGVTEKEVMQKAASMDVHFPRQRWGRVPTEAKHLVKGLLCRDPQKRLTPQQVLAHPFILSPNSRGRMGVLRQNTF